MTKYGRYVEYGRPPMLMLGDAGRRAFTGRFREALQDWAERPGSPGIQVTTGGGNAVPKMPDGAEWTGNAPSTETKDKFYQVSVYPNADLYCSCPSWAFGSKREKGRRFRCKHLVQVLATTPAARYTLSEAEKRLTAAVTDLREPYGGTVTPLLTDQIRRIAQTTALSFEDAANAVTRAVQNGMSVETAVKWVGSQAVAAPNSIPIDMSAERTGPATKRAPRPVTIGEAAERFSATTGVEVDIVRRAIENGLGVNSFEALAGNSAAELPPSRIEEFVGRWMGAEQREALRRQYVGRVFMSPAGSDNVGRDADVIRVNGGIVPTPVQVERALSGMDGRRSVSIPLGAASRQIEDAIAAGMDELEALAVKAREKLADKARKREAAGNTARPVQPSSEPATERTEPSPTYPRRVPPPFEV